MLKGGQETWQRDLAGKGKAKCMAERRGDVKRGELAGERDGRGAVMEKSGGGGEGGQSEGID
jgi:hypothetical protein